MRAVRTTGVYAAPEDGAEQVTQLLPAEYAEVRERSGDWLRVTVPGQPSGLDPAGYPGWVRAGELVHDEDSLLAVARTYLGTPYVWGAMTADGIDCSALVHVCFRAVGAIVPRDAVDQAAAADPVVLGGERPGDLWFFADDADSAAAGGRVTHVGFVTGPGVMLHASGVSRRGRVVEEELDAERLAARVAAGRLPSGRS